jgi:delta8-fatty-acid desaturase
MAMSSIAMLGCHITPEETRQFAIWWEEMPQMKLLCKKSLPTNIMMLIGSRLHSPEAKKRMESYRIGRIAGRWENFVPPIQGGVFRRLGEESNPGKGTVTPDSVSESSGASSPISEPIDGHSTLRHRKAGLDTPPSSASSSEDLTLLSTPYLAHMDAITQKEIDLDLSKYPSLDPEVQDEIVVKYRALNERIKAEGLFQCNYTAYLYEAIRYALLFATSMYLLQAEWYMSSAVFLGLFWHQLVFSAHDAGHMGITHNLHIDTCIGIFITDFLGGLSIGWWKRNHNVHHIVTNSPEHDPDIQHMPFFAISARFVDSLKSTYYDHVMWYDAVSKVTIKVQDYLYYVILAFGRFNLYRLTWTYILLRQAPRKGPAWWHYWVEVVGQFFFWSWFGYGILYRCMPNFWTGLGYLMVSHMVTSPVHVQITLSHFGMSTADLGPKESFPQKMLRTTLDVDCPEWLDFVHGGLQFQAIHHLYPRIPRHNLRKTQKLVKEFCDDVKIPYAILGFTDGNKQVIGRLGEVARQAKLLAEVQRRMIEEEGLASALGH